MMQEHWVYLKITNGHSSRYFEKIQVAQAKGLKEDHVKSEVMVKQQARLVEGIRVLRTFQRRLWIPKVGGVCDTLL